MKKCSGCKEEKPLTEFSKNRSAKDGVQSTCKACQAAHYVANRERIRAQNNAWHQNNKEKERLSKQEYYRNNREAILARNKKWHEANILKHRKRIAKRRAAMLNAVPEWADHEQIAAIYAMAKWLELTVLGQKYHVDHVVPLQNSLVCGLHVHQNLSIVRASENLSKGNRFSIEDQL